MDMTGVRLTELVEAAGCAAKIAPGALAKVLGDLPRTEDPNLLVGFDASDDACVYDLGNGRGLVQTCDFFPPMVDDPFLFGQVAAANALSDVYAMGGEPKLALNLLCFPNCLGIEVAGQILAGGADRCQLAGCVVAGGHSINDHEPKYGLSVTGFSLMGHSCEMAEASGVTLQIDADAVPMLDGAREMARMGMLPAGAYRNRDFFGPRVQMGPDVLLDLADVLFDPQTSGGLLVSVDASQADVLVSRLRDEGLPAAVIGQVAERGQKSVEVR